MFKVIFLFFCCCFHPGRNYSWPATLQILSLCSKLNTQLNACNKKLNCRKTGHLTNQSVSKPKLCILYLQLDKGGMCISWVFRHNKGRHTTGHLDVCGHEIRQSILSSYSISSLISFLDFERSGLIRRAIFRHPHTGTHFLKCQINCPFRSMLIRF